MRRSFCFGTGLLFLATLAQPAAANIIDNFNSDDGTTDTTKPVTCSPGSGCGSVTLSQVNPTTVLVTISLTNTGAGFSNFAGNNVFGFNIGGDPAITITNFSSGAFTAGSTNITEDSMYGKFDYTISCSTCGTTHPTTLSFDVSLTGGDNLIISKFDTKSTGGTVGAYFFAADQGNGNRQGIIASLPSPEAPTFAFFASPLVALFFLRRRRFRTATPLMGR